MNHTRETGYPLSSSVGRCSQRRHSSVSSRGNHPSAASVGLATGCRSYTKRCALSAAGGTVIGCRLPDDWTASVDWRSRNRFGHVCEEGAIGSGSRILIGMRNRSASSCVPEARLIVNTTVRGRRVGGECGSGSESESGMSRSLCRRSNSTTQTPSRSRRREERAGQAWAYSGGTLSSPPSGRPYQYL